MKEPIRGEVYWVNLDPTIGSEISKPRPAVIVSINVLNARRNTVIVIPLSSKGVHRPPLVVDVRSAGEDSTARIDQIRTIDKARLRERKGVLNGADLSALDDALRVVVGL